MFYEPLTDIMRVRQTSRQGDETICLATILSLEVDPYLAIPDTPDADAAKGRMRIFLTKINRFDMGLIFNNWERLQIEGFRWAPKTLLAHRGGKGGSEMGVLSPRDSDIQWDGDKAELPVQFPGFSPFDFSKSTRLSIRSSDGAFVIQLKQRESDGSRQRFFVELYPNDVIWGKDTQYAIILSKIPEGDRDEGVLTVISDVSTGSKEVTTIHHLCLVRIRKLKDDTPDWIDTVTTAILTEDTKWLVRYWLKDIVKII